MAAQRLNSLFLYPLLCQIHTLTPARPPTPTPALPPTPMPTLLRTHTHAHDFHHIPALPGPHPTPIQSPHPRPTPHAVPPPHKPTLHPTPRPLKCSRPQPSISVSHGAYCAVFNVLAGGREAGRQIIVIHHLEKEELYTCVDVYVFMY